MANIAVVYYSMYGHVKSLALEIVKGIESAGGKATLLRIPETLSDEVLEKMGAQKPDAEVPEVTTESILEYDGIVFGMPTRFGMAAAQVKAFMDTTGGHWAAGKLVNKTAGIFFSTGTLGGGQETTALTFITQFTHHGMIYVPMGYTHPKMTDLTEIHGGSPYGPGTYAGADGSRLPSELELEMAQAYGTRFATVTGNFVNGAKSG